MRIPLPLCLLLAFGLAASISLGCSSTPQGYADLEDINSFGTVSEQHRAWGLFHELEDLEFSFFDPETNETVAVAGPYRVVYWDMDRVELIGRVAGRRSDARITLREDHDAFWAHLRLSDREFLTRVR